MPGKACHAPPILPSPWEGGGKVHATASWKYARGGRRMEDVCAQRDRTELPLSPCEMFASLHLDAWKANGVRGKVCVGERGSWERRVPFRKATRFTDLHCRPYTLSRHLPIPSRQQAGKASHKMSAMSHSHFQPDVPCLLGKF